MPLRFVYGSAAALVGALLAMLAAAQAQTPSVPAALPASGPASGPAVMAPLSPDQVLTAFAPGDGREVTAMACGACHQPTLITGKHYDAENWSRVVDQMIDRGAVVADADYDTVINYLAAHYGPQK